MNLQMENFHPKTVPSSPGEAGDLNYFAQLPFELTFEYESSRLWIEKNTPILLSIVAIYVAAIWAGSKIMNSRLPFKLKWLFIAWNVSLSLFSLLGTIRICQEFAYTYNRKGLHGTICHANKSNGPYALWSFLFTMSKVLELVDTLFIVLRKSNLIFLHWYHHAVTLAFGVLAASSDLSLGRWIMAMNFTIHFVMYGYYSVKQLGYSVPKMVAMAITSMQLMQMALGLAVFSYAAFINWPLTSGGPTLSRDEGVKMQVRVECETSSRTLITGLLMYFSYLILFVQFFVRSYFGKSAGVKGRNRGKLRLELDLNRNVAQGKKVA